MTAPPITVEATLEPDGMTLQLKEKLALPPGRVIVTVQPAGLRSGPSGQGGLAAFAPRAGSPCRTWSNRSCCPIKQVAEPFRSTVITTKKGKVVQGLLVHETGDALELLLPDAARAVVLRAAVDERIVSPRSPMPAGLVRDPAELRDLLAYLLSEAPLPP